jgi:hypothetical protein
MPKIPRRHQTLQYPFKIPRTKDTLAEQYIPTSEVMYEYGIDPTHMFSLLRRLEILNVCSVIRITTYEIFVSKYFLELFFMEEFRRQQQLSNA